MSLLRVLVCILLPPLAVIDRPIMVFLIVLMLTLLGWIPGIIGAIYFNSQDAAPADGH
ncbi:MAG: YqaE/Pmp3 family membrane protein [Phycisphaerae bacterium]|nr:YqaE/Pmp3 family membrane protein [Phycisphaerae bacterium]|tara:strand:- start:2331 stop:2504 length:174 start_codon:yes stop_codon:yes gene_type:complete